MSSNRIVAYFDREKTFLDYVEMVTCPLKFALDQVATSATSIWKHFNGNPPENIKKIKAFMDENAKVITRLEADVKKKEFTVEEYTAEGKSLITFYNGVLKVYGKDLQDDVDLKMVKSTVDGINSLSSDKKHPIGADFCEGGKIAQLIKKIADFFGPTVTGIAKCLASFGVSNASAVNSLITTGAMLIPGLNVFAIAWRVMMTVVKVGLAGYTLYTAFADFDKDKDTEKKWKTFGKAFGQFLKAILYLFTGISKKKKVVKKSKNRLSRYSRRRKYQ